jgi:hypothetical protein
LKSHPSETDLALLAGGEGGRISRFLLRRHVRSCTECTEQVARFQDLRGEVAGIAPPDVDWDTLAAEMRANIRLGLEAGECVRPRRAPVHWNPRLGVAFASLGFLICAGLIMRSPAVLPRQAENRSPVLESMGNGSELREGASSFALMNHQGTVSDQTVSAEGEIGARYVEGGAVTITNVSF